jgi:hypothetical protein
VKKPILLEWRLDFTWWDSLEREETFNRRTASALYRAALLGPLGIHILRGCEDRA